MANTNDAFAAVAEFARDELATCRSRIVALEAELAATRCPIGLDATPDICSAGTCVKCAGALRERNAALEAENAELKATLTRRDEQLIVLADATRSVPTRLADAEAALRKIQAFGDASEMPLSHACAKAARAYFASAAQPKDKPHD